MHAHVRAQYARAPQRVCDSVISITSVLNQDDGDDTSMTDFISFSSHSPRSACPTVFQPLSKGRTFCQLVTVALRNVMTMRATQIDKGGFRTSVSRGM